MGDAIKIGPWGGQGGKIWMWNGPIQKILVKYGSVVDSITFGFIQNGVTTWSERFGGKGGGCSEEISVMGPEEYLVTISGTTGKYYNINSLITSLTFISNKRSYGPFGQATGTNFTVPVEGGKILSFHGRCGDFLDAIGFHLVPLSWANPKPSMGLDPNDQTGTVKAVGPWGGEGGGPWKWDGNVEKILVKNGDVVDSVTFGYIKDGVTVWSQRFGGTGGRPTEITINKPDEFLVGVRGTTAKYYTPTPVVTSIAFITNQRTYGPYGIENGNQFSYTVQEESITGFFGRYGAFLDAFGLTVVSLGLPTPIPPI